MTSLVRRRTAGPSGRRRARALGSPAVLLAPLALLALAACGGASNGPDVASAGSGGATTSPGASTGSTQQGDATKFVECMKKYGVDVEVEDDGNGRAGIRIKGGRKGDAGAMDKAQQECRRFAPGGGSGGVGRAVPKKEQEKFLAFARCMRDHGIPMQDPTFDGGGVRLMIGEGAGKGPEPDDSAVRAAQQACQSLLPTDAPQGPGGGPAAGPGGGA
jgi:hypothetical protein